MADTQIVPSNYMPTHPDTGGWKGRHKSAMYKPASVNPMAAMITAWVRYAETVEENYSNQIGTDYVLGPGWAQIGVGLRTLLNGELNGLDGGTLDHIIYQNLVNQGFDEEGKYTGSKD